MPNCLVREVMSSPAIVIEWDATILEAAALMESHNIRRLPVVDEDGVLVGIISTSDVREATSVYSTASPYAPDQDEIILAVDEVMSSPVHTVSPDDRMLDVVRLMQTYKIGGIPVVDADDHVLGIVTESDVFQLLIQEWEKNEAASRAVEAGQAGC
ncbi:MAG: CBS domain-containing protein [Chloroflexi bacterium]|nr:MAG: CBS domain-containing protein [Chloroflexota bacterium]